MKKLLIIGAGGHGRVVQEIAETLGYECAFLDDHNPEAIGRVNDLDSVMDDFDECFVAIGDNEKRKQISKRVKNSAILIHPSAIVSDSVKVGTGTVICAGAIVNTRAIIGNCCIISIGVLVDHDSVVADFSHLNTGAICMAGSYACGKIDAGSVVRNAIGQVIKDDR